LLKLSIIICLSLLAIKALVLALERTIPYVPSRQITLNPDDFIMTWENVNFSPKNDINIKLHGWLIKTQQKRKSTILYFHGNAGNITNRLPIAHNLTEAGYDVFLFDYRGYGKSEGSPSEKGLYDDALGAYSFLIENKKIKPEELILMGRSLGCAVSLELALHSSARAVIIISPFTSLKDMARANVIFYPLSFFASDAYNNKKKIRSLICPLLIAHSYDDEIIPFRMGKTLFDLANPPKAFYQFTGGHNDDYFEKDDFIKKINNFTDSLK